MDSGTTSQQRVTHHTMAYTAMAFLEQFCTDGYIRKKMRKLWLQQHADSGAVV
jgi:hypothetical protein